ncbi:MAG: hypothetical protein ACI4N3_03770 [Alphaproteobacteria bacterium]
MTDDAREKVIVTSLVIAIVVGSVTAGYLMNKNIEKEAELPLSAGTVVEKVDINTEYPKVMFLIDTDDNKDTIEKVMVIEKDSISNVSIINSIKEGSQIKFKDKYPHLKGLFSENIYQIDDLIVNQR